MKSVFAVPFLILLTQASFAAGSLSPQLIHCFNAEKTPTFSVETFSSRPRLAPYDDAAIQFHSGPLSGKSYFWLMLTESKIGELTAQETFQFSPGSSNMATLTIAQQVSYQDDYCGRGLCKKQKSQLSAKLVSTSGQVSIHNCERGSNTGAKAL